MIIDIYEHDRQNRIARAAQKTREHLQAERQLLMLTSEHPRYDYDSE
jgi:hypothetical protein